MGKLIKVRDEVYETLKRLKQNGESFSSLLLRLATFYIKLDDAMKELNEKNEWLRKWVLKHWQEDFRRGKPVKGSKAEETLAELLRIAKFRCRLCKQWFKPYGAIFDENGRLFYLIQVCPNTSHQKVHACSIRIKKYKINFTPAIREILKANGYKNVWSWSEYQKYSKKFVADFEPREI